MGGCVTRYRELSLTADSFDDTLQPDQVKFYGFTLTHEWLQKKADLIVRVHVSRGRLRGVYCARDQPFPNQRRKLWSTERFCNCPSPSCDHCYPNCLNEAGGVCTECNLHDEKFERIQHDPAMGGMALQQGKMGSSSAAGSGEAGGGGGQGDPGGGGGMGMGDDESSGAVELALGALASDAAASGGESDRLFDPPFPHQTDYEFSLRLSTTSPSDSVHLTRPGHFFLTIAAAPERISRALRKQRLREGEEELHPTTVSIWIEEARPKADPRAGNEARVQEALQRTKERLQVQQQKRTFGRRMERQGEEKVQAQAEAKLMHEYGLDESPAAATSKRAVVERKADVNVERKEEEEHN